MKIFKDYAYRVSIISIVLNILLSIFKLLAGIFGHSKAMISDGIHSISDILSTIIVIIGIYISKKSPDQKHQYGHERYECVAAIVLSFILFLTGLFIGYTALFDLINGNYKIYTISIITIFAAIISIIVKEWMFIYTMKIAKKINSTALMADAYHHRSDSLSSIAALIGISGTMVGLKMLDSIASLVITLFILKAAFDILKDALDKVMDTSVGPNIEKSIYDTIKKEDGVIRIDDLKTRLFGSKMFVDVEISVDALLNIKDAHAIAQNIHDKIEKNFSSCKHCMVHINPYKNT